MTPLVDYLIARAGLPPRLGLAYDYILAGDGLYLAAENTFLSVRVPVAHCTVRGLPPVFPSVVLKAGRIPQELWDAIVRVARRQAERGRETLMAVTWDARGGYRLVLPRQLTGPASVHYRPPAAAVLIAHSHGSFPAFFSTTDDADEQGLCLYSVLGRMDTPSPEVAIRAGAYGAFLPVPWETIFHGDRGACRDVSYETTPLGDGGDSDDLPD